MIDMGSSTKESEHEERFFENSIYSLYGETSAAPLMQPTSTGDVQLLPESTYDVVEPVHSNAKEGGQIHDIPIAAKSHGKRSGYK